MACGQVIGRFPFSIWATSFSETVLMLVAQPLLIVGGKELDYALTIDRVTGSAQVTPATALFVARTDVIASVTAASGGYKSAQGVTHHATDLTGATSHYFAQPALLAKLSADPGTPGMVTGHVSVILRACGQSIGNRDIEVDQNQTNGAPRIYRLGRVPATGADKLRAALVSNGMKDIEYLFLVRGVTDPDAPGSWVSVGSFATIADGASAICKSDASLSAVTPANHHLLEFALSLRLKSAGAAPAGFVRVGAGMSTT